MKRRPSPEAKGSRREGLEHKPSPIEVFLENLKKKGNVVSPVKLKRQLMFAFMRRYPRETN